MSWVRVPPEADGRVRKYSNAGYFSLRKSDYLGCAVLVIFHLGKVTTLGVLCCFALLFV